ncbi:MAG: diaminopimelate epimerase [Chloroflexi bacterium]|nr:diaminopimelate epimerase [Chloroflexota bacterium]
MRFTKLHGTGNDFVLVDARELERDWSSLAKRICDRHFGIGADGLILVLPSDVADLRMRMFNPDGTESEMCGNGVRCFVKFAVEGGIATLEHGALRVETLAGVLPAEAAGSGGGVESVRVGMGQPRFAPQEIPVAAEAEPPITNLPLSVDDRQIAVTCLSMGNPHAVYLSDEPVAAFPLEAIGPKIERHDLFPKRVNFEVARVLSRDRIEARVWERGAGATLACGSGASAVMVAARLAGVVDNRAEIRLPGGSLTLEWDGQGDVFLTGPAVEVFAGEWPE